MLIDFIIRLLINITHDKIGFFLILIINLITLTFIILSKFKQFIFFKFF